MKLPRLTLIATLVLGLSAVAPLARAEDKPADPSPSKPGVRARGEARKSLADELGLAADQKTKLKPIMKEQQEKLAALRNDTNLSPQQRREKAKEIRQATDEKIKALLTAEQKTKFEELQKKRPAGAHKGRKQQ